MIYFIRSGDAVKIGYSANVANRRRTLRTGNPNMLVVLGVMDGDRANEDTIQRRFWAHHIHGDWFRINDAILAYIEDNCRPYLLGARRLDLLPPREPEINPLDRLALFALIAGTAPALLLTAEQRHWVEWPDWLGYPLLFLVTAALAAGFAHMLRNFWRCASYLVAEIRHQRAVKRLAA